MVLFSVKMWPIFSLVAVYLEEIKNLIYRLTTTSRIRARIPNSGRFQKRPNFCPEFSKIPIFVPNFQKIPIFSKNYTYLRLNAGMAKKRVFLKKNAGLVFFWFYLVFWGFIGFFGVLLGFIDFSPSNYRVLLGFIGFFRVLEQVFGCFWFLPFWAIFDFSPIHYQVFCCFMVFY